ncbi:MAG: hypothetical protein DME26_00695 [Verrucomicrobia bacterium]|nr:MAG: hypothetical protein DME26_00695 [Verrucomicrobiota bacterium]
MTGLVTARRIAISDAVVKSAITRTKLVHEPEITHQKQHRWHFCWHFCWQPGDTGFNRTDWAKDKHAAHDLRGTTMHQGDAGWWNIFPEQAANALHMSAHHDTS